jgi:30S ribosomal protein S31
MSGTGAFLFIPARKRKIREFIAALLIDRGSKYCFMGRGDKKTKKGKIFKGSFGKSRPRGKKKAAVKKPAT